MLPSHARKQVVLCAGLSNFAPGTSYSEGTGRALAIAEDAITSTLADRMSVAEQTSRLPARRDGFALPGRGVKLSTIPLHPYRLSSIQAGAWSLALGSPRTQRSTPAAIKRVWMAGESRRWSRRMPLSAGQRLYS